MSKTSSLEEFERHGAWLGAPTIRRMIGEALVDESQNLDAQREAISDRLTCYEPDDLDPVRNPGLVAECGEVTTALGYFPRKSTDGQKSGRVLRAKANYYVPGATGPRLKALLRRTIEDSPGNDTIVIFDRDPRFRAAFKTVSDEKNLGLPIDRPHALIIALADSIETEWISTVATACNAKADSTVVLVTAEELRASRLNIVEYGSIEQTVKDVVRYTTKEPLKSILNRCHHLIIVFEEAGAIYLSRDKDGKLAGSVHYCPNFDRVAQMEQDDYGRTPGRMFIALTAIVKWIASAMRESPGQPWDLAPGVRLGVVAYNLHFSEGFDKNPFQTIENALGPERRRRLQAVANEREFFTCSVDFQVDAALDTWSRVDNEVGKVGIDELVRRIVKIGPDKAFRLADAGKTRSSYPPLTITCPYLEVGRIKTVDHVEIERFIALMKLIRGYLRDPSWTTPLSIAVFGPPGSGKSFAVKELLKTVNPGAKDQPVLTYNLAQFDSVGLLTEAFHQVQDRALASDDAPLVIFDEFDCNFERARLGWLKYFLAPMQDGLFRGQSIEYRVGRAIFVFAGGTFWTFRKFQDASDSTPPSDHNPKLKDFISRLKGHLDIRGINPPVPSDPTESEHELTLRMIRRAMILRSLLLEYAKPVIRPGAEAGAETAEVDDTVIDRFLKVACYSHGVRSMESVIRMSRPIVGRLLPASIPSKEQLEMHAPEFWPDGDSP